MADELNQIKLLLIEERNRREAAEKAQTEAERGRAEEQRRREEEQRRREEEQRRREEEQRRREEVEERTRKTTLPEYLDVCHKHLYLSLAIQKDATQSTQGKPANAKNKLRPERFVAWSDFPERQQAIWNDVMRSGFALEQHFTSAHTIRESGDGLNHRPLSSELDLNHFQRTAIESPVSLIVNHLHQNRFLQQKFGIQGSVSFENHANSLSPEAKLGERMEQLSISGDGLRRSSRLEAQAMAKSAAPAPVIEQVQVPHPRADQFCIYNTGTTDADNRVAAFIIEYKAPHKLPLGFIYEGLEDMDLKNVVIRREGESLKDRFRRLIAAVITQAFSYMISAGLEYGCVCTGEASIFLRIPKDPTTVYYFLSVPKGDVGVTTGWSPELNSANRLHLTAVGQMLAFTLQALKTPPRCQQWRNNAIAQLNSWEVVYQELKDSFEKKEEPSSEYRPPRHMDFFRMFPIRLRPRPPLVNLPDDPPTQDQHDSSDEPDVDTPSRQRSDPQRSSHAQSTSGSLSTNRNTNSTRGTRREAQQGRYCTQRCLMGLVNDGTLDPLCPNVLHHGKDRHLIDLTAFLLLIRQQLSEDLDTNCKPVGRPGACGVLFQLRLQPYGYTVAAKATPVYLAHRVKREAAIYEHLRPIQGTYVPVYLGSIDLEVPYLYEGIAYLVHMMLLSFGGKRISQRYKENRELVSQQVDTSARALHNLGVLHKDLMPRNMLWNEETGKVMIIDFDQAEIIEEQHRPVLGQISNNRNRNRKEEPDTSKTKQIYDNSTVFTRERRNVAAELRALG